MEGKLKFLIIFIMELVTGCASAPKSRDWNWVYIWNRATSVGEMERAASLMEQHDYIRYSEQVVRNYVNPNLGSTPPYDVEKEVVYFKLAAQFLWEWQVTGKNAEKARVYARKLAELPGLHSFSKFLIARVQEMSGGTYNRFYVPVPYGEKVWWFSVGGATNVPTEVSFGDFRAEYDRILHEKEGGFIGKSTQAGCFVALICLTGVSSDDGLVIDDLKSGIYLTVTDSQGRPVKIGESSWNEVAKSQ